MHAGDGGRSSARFYSMTVCLIIIVFLGIDWLVVETANKGNKSRLLSKINTTFTLVFVAFIIWKMVLLFAGTGGWFDNWWNFLTYYLF